MGHISVSYTHLDVWLAQVLARLSGSLNLAAISSRVSPSLAMRRVWSLM
ncbi:hypothetical protein AZZ82_000546, partial [Klebsiella aerogenes]